MKKVFLIVSLFLATALYAHEFWLQTNQHHYRVGETATICFKVGEDFTGENWTGDRNKVQQLVEYLPKKEKIDISNQLSTQKGDSLQIPIMEEGTYMFIYNSKNSHINLEAEKFNAYLKEDGLQNALDYRLQHGETNMPSSENYQRSVKTILQCGIKTTNACTKPTSLPFDIVPMQNPAEPGYDTNDKTIRYKVYFKTVPMENLLIRHWWKHLDGTKGNKIYTTDKNGLVKIKTEKGENMISCVHMERLQNNTSAQWQSYWGSLTFSSPGSLFPVRRN